MAHRYSVAYLPAQAANALLEQPKVNATSKFIDLPAALTTLLLNRNTKCVEYQDHGENKFAKFHSQNLDVHFNLSIKANEDYWTVIYKGPPKAKINLDATYSLAKDNPIIAPLKLKIESWQQSQKTLHSDPKSSPEKKRKK